MITPIVWDTKIQVSKVRSEVVRGLGGLSQYGTEGDSAANATATDMFAIILLFCRCSIYASLRLRPPLTLVDPHRASQAASVAILDCCNTNLNPDIKGSIAHVVKAICKPSETVKAVEKLMHTTFVVSVDAPTLSILCPVLSRALKEKVSILTPA